MTPEERRAIFDRIVERWGQRGFVFETSPVFRASVEEWIDGRISVDELRQRYRDLLHRRSGHAAVHALSEKRDLPSSSGIEDSPAFPGQDMEDFDKDGGGGGDK